MRGEPPMTLPPHQAVTNRSVPTATIIPVLAYEDVVQATDWLCQAFGFIVRLRIGRHRAQLVFGDGAVIVTERPPDSPAPNAHAINYSVHVRVEDIDHHCERAREAGARILHPPTDYFYGERQYDAEDLGGHRWT